MLQFVLGGLDRAKKSVLLDHLLDIQAKEPEAQFFYLVPEHLKFDMESYLLAAVQDKEETNEAALVDIQVVSFKRLAWFLMPNSLAEEKPISSIGQIMIIKRLLARYQDQLQVFRGQVKHQGFAEKLAQLFDELYLGQIQPENLSQVPDLNQQEAKRLAELAMLYQGFIQEIEGQVLGHYHDLQRLDSYLKAQPLSRPTYLVVDHHYFFNGQQLQLLTTLIQQCQAVWITLPLSQQAARSKAYDPLIEVARHTYGQMQLLAQSLHLPVAEDWTINQVQEGYQANILTLAQAFENHLRLAPQELSQPLNQVKTHVIWENDAIQTEVRHTSNKIHQLVSQEGYRYRDILVLTRDMDRYRPLVIALFEQNDIPYFYDHAVSMGQHPLVLWLESGLKLYRYRYQLADIFGILKSGLWLPADLRAAMAQNPQDGPALEEEFKAQVDLLENVVLANGYVGYRFAQLSFEWRFDQADRPYVNAAGQLTGQTYGQVVQALRQSFLADFAPYQDLAQLTSFSGQKAAEWLYQWLEEVGVKDRLIARRDQAIEKGDLALSRQYEQVWQTLTASLDEFYQLYGEAQLTFSEFQELLLTGLNEATFHIIPPALDQVMVTSMESPQVQAYKVCFVLGADELTLPKHHQEDSLLSVANRQSLGESLLPYQQLRQSSQHNHSLELLMTQQILLSASDRLYLSYVAMKGQQTVKLSPYLQQLAKQFHLPIKTYTHTLIHQNQVKLSRLEFGRYPVQMSPLLQLVHHYSQQKDRPSAAFLDFLTLMASQNPHTWVLLAQLFQFNQLPQNLTPETALALFGQKMTASVSKLEQYYQDPYSHFLLYGLKIRPRQQLELNAAGAGDYYHDFLDKFTQAQQASPDFEANFASIQTLMAEDLRFNIFGTNPRMHLIKRKLDQHLRQFLSVSLAQSQALTVQPVATELVFGSQQEAGLILPLDKGSLTLRGKIDRIDADPSQSYYQVVDYKSGKKTFNLVDFYYGLDLQVLTYLKVASQRYPHAQAVGAFYQSLAGGFVKVDGKQMARLSQDGLDLAKSQLHPYRGLMTISGSELVAIEPGLANQSKSQIYPVQLKKDGSYYQHVPAVNQAELSLINQHLVHLMTQAGNAIQRGDISLAPFKDERFTPSLQADYRVITGFDATVHYGAYRHKRLAKDQVLAQIEKEASKKEDTETSEKGGQL
ncbi:PD-(D/E)XK nuclease family protein [Abiotrophia defectiva]|uniref:PD-(D/E)XK nuclease family protein n=1 Tax=Abiotrophia defectiva TaxID=46125 RepID=UPI0028E754FF|nr:PD-(D/E)XK nuclease family protein [Abiotrophia defectiva]